MESQFDSGSSTTDEPVATLQEPASGAVIVSASNHAQSQTLLMLPVDTLVQVMRYMLPMDILHLARTNKALRDFLMKKSAMYVWTGAIQNVPGLPPCPSHISTPRYIAFVFGNTCTVCGRCVEHRMDHKLYIRLCRCCEPKALVPRQNVREYFHDLLPWSICYVPKMQNGGPGAYTLAADLQRLEEEYMARMMTGPPILEVSALKEDPWYKAKRQAKKERREHTSAMGRYLRGRRPPRRLRCDQEHTIPPSQDF